MDELWSPEVLLWSHCQNLKAQQTWTKAWLGQPTQFEKLSAYTIWNTFQEDSDFKPQCWNCRVIWMTFEEIEDNYLSKAWRHEKNSKSYFFFLTSKGSNGDQQLHVWSP